MSLFCLLEILTTLITIAALGFAIYQSVLARKALDSAKVAINNDTKARQLASLPQTHEVILVKLSIEKWLEDLLKFKSKIKESISKQDPEILNEVVLLCPINAVDSIRYFDKKNINEFPESLKIIAMSGAQYFYNAGAPVRYCVKENGDPDLDYARGLLPRIEESIDAINELQSLIKNMIPEVLFETPASMRNSEFFRK
jgi:hypothetical protein